MKRYYLFLLILIASACEALQPLPTATLLPPTRIMQATLASSPTPLIRSSDELYDDTLSGQNDPTAAALPNEGAMPPLVSGTREPSGAEIVQIVMEDGVLLLADLYETPQVARVPGVMLLGSDLTSWGLLPVQLTGLGWTVMVVEMRPDPLASDMEALLLALSELGTVDPARIAVIGAGAGADAGLLGCAVNALCDALVLLSPRGRDTLLNFVSSYSPRPLLVAAGRDDQEAFDTSVTLVGAASGQRQFLEFESGSGTDLLALNPALNDSIVGWLSERMAAVAPGQ